MKSDIKDIVKVVIIMTKIFRIIIKILKVFIQEENNINNKGEKK